jgi:hypothetical protein
MNVKLEQRANIKFCAKLGKSGAETFGMTLRENGNEAMSRGRCFEWHGSFKRGRTSLEDDKNSYRYMLRVRSRPKPSDFSGEKIVSIPAFGREVKLFAPCCRFAACQRTP